MARLRRKYLLETENLALRLPAKADFQAWSSLRETNEEFLQIWEPKRRADQHSYQQFLERVKWSRESFKAGRAVALLIFRKSDATLIGAITLDNIRKGPAQSATVGYWLGEKFTRQGYMKEALDRVVAYAFANLDLSRVEAATLEENLASRRLLENSGFRYEGVAQAYLQINGRWRQHVLYANLRRDRLGTTKTGVY